MNVGIYLKRFTVKNNDLSWFVALISLTSLGYIFQLHLLTLYDQSHLPAEIETYRQSLCFPRFMRALMIGASMLSSASLVKYVFASMSYMKNIYI